MSGEYSRRKRDMSESSCISQDTECTVLSGDSDSQDEDYNISSSNTSAYYSVRNGNQTTIPNTVNNGICQTSNYSTNLKSAYERSQRGQDAVQTNKTSGYLTATIQRPGDVRRHSVPNARVHKSSRQHQPRHDSISEHEGLLEEYMHEPLQETSTVLPHPPTCPEFPQFQKRNSFENTYETIGNISHVDVRLEMRELQRKNQELLCWKSELEQRQAEVEKSFKRYKRYSVMYCIIMVAIVVLGVFVGIMINRIIPPTENTTQPPPTTARTSPYKESLCSHCSNFDFDIQDRLYKAGEEMCCFRGIEQVFKILDRKYKDLSLQIQELAATCFSDIKTLGKRIDEVTSGLPAKSGGNCISGCDKTIVADVAPTSPPSVPIRSAHVFAGKQERTNSTHLSGAHQIKNWLHVNTSTRTETTHLEGLHLHNDELHVEEDGLYYVYSQIGFELYYDTNSAVSGQSQDLYHYVKRFNPVLPNGGRQVLLKSTTSQCWEQQKTYGHYTSYLGAVLKLSRGDRIYVAVSKISLAKDPNNNYFGLFKIS